jgi:hypothetical protein
MALRQRSQFIALAPCDAQQGAPRRAKLLGHGQAHAPRGAGEDGQFCHVSVSFKKSKNRGQIEKSKNRGQSPISLLIFLLGIRSMAEAGFPI